MEQAAHRVLADVANCSVLALLLALICYALWRRRARLRQIAVGDGLEPASVQDFEHSGWKAPGTLPRFGKVVCHGYDLIDAILVFLLIWLSRNLVVHGARANELAAMPQELGGGELLFGLVITVLLGAVLVFYMVVLRGRRLAEWLGLDRVTPAAAFLYALAFIIPSFAIVVLVSEAFSRTVLIPLGFDESPQQIVQAFADAPNPVFRLFIAISACAVAPVVEELTFRGFFYPVLKRFTDAPFAALVTAIFFGLVHQHLGGFLPLTALALVLVVAYEWTGSLLVPVLIHALFNATEVFLIWKLGPTLQV